MQKITNSQIEHQYGLDLTALVSDIKKYMPSFNDKKFIKAYKFSFEAHEGQFRKGGQPYITHPFETVKILKSLHVDEDTLIAALLHDVPEDTSRTIDDVQLRFGKRVAFLVEGITKLSKVHYQQDMAKRQVESLRKLFIHTARDPRIIIIKLADRLHNMRTLQFIEKPEKKTRISKETMEVFVPIANLLGIEELKAELEDLCFKHLYPEDYNLLLDRTKTSYEKNSINCEETIQLVERKLQENDIAASVYNRRKNLYSIYKRILMEQNKLQDFDDFIALRVIVRENDECYKALGLIHGLFKPKPGKFKDYIAVPKRNGYQSLHTTVFGIRGLNTEFQIRTHQMHLEAEFGIAAHYFEDQRSKNPHLEEDQRADWAAKIVQYNNSQIDNENEDFMENLKLDIFHDRIFVFTPKGDHIDLPHGATCVDFAYEIHTEVGHRALKAEVNGETVPLTTKLQNGDTITIITSDLPKSPNRAWLAFVKTQSARNKILDYFKKISKEEKMDTGRVLLQKELDRAGMGLIKDISDKKIQLFCADKHCTNFDDLLMKLGEGTLQPVEFVNYLNLDTTNEETKSKFVTEQKLTAEKKTQNTLVTVKIISKDNVGQLKRILKVLEELNISSLKTNAYLSLVNKLFICKLSVLVDSYSRTSLLFENLEQVDGVIRVERLFWQRKVQFVIGSLITFGLWISHPFLIHFIYTQWEYTEIHPIFLNILLYTGIMMLFVVVFLLKRITHRSFPELRETNTFWGITFLLTAFAIITLIAEIYFFDISFNWIFILGSVLFIVTYLSSEYFAYKKN
jgi:GTP diphosphokinase / guanosine-3',5'-bis(diphosphate) 3'-diphosphatase